MSIKPGVAPSLATTGPDNEPPYPNPYYIDFPPIGLTALTFLKGNKYFPPWAEANNGEEWCLTGGHEKNTATTKGTTACFNPVFVRESVRDIRW